MFAMGIGDGGTTLARALRGLLAGLVCAGLALLWPAAASAQNPQAASAFQVSDVPVDATAASAAAARDVAMTQGHRRAYERLIRRLVPRGAPVPNQTDAAISDLVSSVQVSNERTSTTRYIANLTFRFRPDRVRQLLVSAGLPMTESRAQPRLVLPIFHEGATAILWEESNPWRDAWDTRDFDADSLVPLVLPSGDAADQGVVSAAQALGNDPSRLMALARRYGTAEVVIAEATQSAPNKIDLILRVLGSGGETTAIESVTGGGDETALFREAASRAVARLEEDWKRGQAVRFDAQERISVRVPLDGSLQSWVGIRNRLASTNVVQRIEVSAISRLDAQVVLHYFGSTEQLVGVLAQRNLELTQADGFWTLRARAGPGG